MNPDFGGLENPLSPDYTASHPANLVMPYGTPHPSPHTTSQGAPHGVTVRPLRSPESAWLRAARGCNTSRKKSALRAANWIWGKNHSKDVGVKNDPKMGLPERSISTIDIVTPVTLQTAFAHHPPSICFNISSWQGATVDLRAFGVDPVTRVLTDLKTMNAWKRLSSYPDLLASRLHSLSGVSFWVTIAVVLR